MKNYAAFILILISGVLWAAPTGVARPAPERLPQKPKVELQWVSPLEDCEPELVCVQGLIKNAGGKTAYNVILRIEIGGTKYIKPKITFRSPVDARTMETGDQQEFYFEMERKIAYKERGKYKSMDVGKYNFKVVPLWTRSSKKATKKTRYLHE